MANWQAELEQVINARFDKMVEMRRHLHRHPEVSGEEFETSLLLYQLLGNDGFQVRLGPEGRGVIADLDPPENGKTNGIFAIRADIDALRIRDEKDVPYRSIHDGVMHACGHDGHTAVVFGAISAIAELYHRGSLPFRPRLRGIFQPAEETCQARADDRRRRLGWRPSDHCGAYGPHPSGRKNWRAFGGLDGKLRCMHIAILGRGGHAARPHEARDPIAAAAQLIQWIYLQIPRATDSQEAVVVTIGQIQGGHTANVIPERVEFTGRSARWMMASDNELWTISVAWHAAFRKARKRKSRSFRCWGNAIRKTIPELIELITETRWTLGPTIAPEEICVPAWAVKTLLSTANTSQVRCSDWDVVRNWWAASRCIRPVSISTKRRFVLGRGSWLARQLAGRTPGVAENSPFGLESVDR